MTPKSAFTLEPISSTHFPLEIHAAAPMDVVKGLALAKKAQEDMLKWDLEKRILFLEFVAELIDQNAESFSEISAEVQGLPQKFVLNYEIKPAAQEFRKAAKEVSQSHDHVRPTGLTAIILPWTMGFRVLSETLSRTLAAGNAALIKPSRKNILPGIFINQIFQKLPEEFLISGLVQVFQGSGDEIGSLLAQHPSVKAVQFTGKNATAEKLQSAVRIGKKHQWRLSGSNSLMILSEADLEPALDWIFSVGLVGQGQMPFSFSKILVLEAFEKKFIEMWTERLNKAGVSMDSKGSGIRGPLLSDEATLKFKTQIQQLQNEGSRWVTGGVLTDRQADPTLVMNLSHCSVLQQEELLAPIYLLSAVKYSHEMAKWNNTGDFGLMAQIFGETEKAQRLAAKLEVSDVWINGGIELAQSLPLGSKSSGFGILDQRVFGGFYSEPQKSVSR